MVFSSTSQYCGLVYGQDSHHLDHIATLCACLDIPLIVSDEALEQQAKRYYPQLVTFLFPYLILPQKIIESYDLILTTMPLPVFNSFFSLAKQLTNKNPLSVWCPHGNSDKGKTSFFMETLRQENAVGVYGQKMLDFLKEKKALSQACQLISLGNYRYSFYQKHQNFYKKLIEKEVLSKLVKNQPLYLYAPTWDDHESGSSFHFAIRSLLENLPNSINLVIKLHPNTLLAEDMAVKRLIWKYETEPNVLFLEDFPLIYPLLDIADLYIGDTSSIGYDFLAFNKPMFFLKTQGVNPLQDLHVCGTVLQKDDLPLIYTKIQESLATDTSLFAKKRKDIYAYTFQEVNPFEQILPQLHTLYKRYVS